MRAFLFIFLCLNISIFLTSNAFAQDAKLVKQGEWGSGTYEKVVEINGYYYVETSSHQIDVFDSMLTGKEALIAQIDFEFEGYPGISSIGRFKDSLVVVTGEFLTIYSIEKTSDLTEQFKISVNSTRGQTSVTQGDYLYFIDQDSRIYIIEEAEGVFNLVKVIQEEQNIESDDNWKSIYERRLYVSDSNIYYISNIQKADSSSTKIVSFDVNNFNPVARGELLGFTAYSSIYVGDGRLVLSSYDHMYMVSISDSTVNILNDFDAINGYYFSGLTYKDNILRAFSHGTVLNTFEISPSNTTAFLSEQILSLPSGNITDSQWFDDKYIVLTNSSGLLDLELNNNLVTNINFVYNQSGSMGEAIIENDYLYLPRFWRIDVVNISDTKNIQLESSIDEKASNFYKMNEEIIALTNNSIKNLSIINTGLMELNSEVSNNLAENVIHENSQLFAISHDNGYKIKRYNIENSYALYEAPLVINFPALTNTCPDKISILGEHLIAFDSCGENKVHLFTDFNNDLAYNKTLPSNDGFWLSETVDEFIYYIGLLGIEIVNIDDDELQVVDFFDIPQFDDTIIDSTKVKDGFLLVITENFFHLIDVSIPTSPKYISKTTMEGTIRHAKIQFSGGYIVVTMEEQGKVKLFKINNAPTANLTSLTFVEDQVKEPVIAFTDPESDALTFTITQAPLHGEVSIDELGLIYTPSENFYGEDSVTIKAEDIHGNDVVQKFILTTTAVNDAPVAGSISFIFFEDETLTEHTNSSDVDSETLTYEVLSTASNGSIELNNLGEFTYIPVLNYFGQDQFTFKVTDELGESAEGIVVLNIVAVNDTPTIATANFSTNEDTELTGKLDAVDVEMHNVTFELVADSAVNGSVKVSSTGDFVFNPVANFNGVASFSIKVTDSESAIEEYEVTIIVNAVNDAPIVEDSSANLNEGGNYSFVLPKVDIDGDPLLYVLISNVTNGSLTLASNGEYTYIPSNTFSGNDSFVFEVTDGPNTSQAKVSLSVKAKPKPQEKSKSGGSMGYLVLIMLLTVMRFRIFTRNY